MQEPIDPLPPRIRRYECPKGHQWEATNSPEWEFTTGNSPDSINVKGLVCMACLFTKVLQDFPAMEVPEGN